MLFLYVSRYHRSKSSDTGVKRLVINRQPWPYDTNCAEYSHPRGGLTRDNCWNKCQAETFLFYCGCHFVELDLNPFLLNSSIRLCSLYTASRCLTNQGL